jgi:CheY-like chemotaxis protein
MTEVMIVEDDVDVQAALEETLIDAGYRVVAVSNGVEALEALASGPLPKVILLDLMMPVMDGWQFREAQRKDPRLAHIPVVVLSAHGDSQSIEAAAYLRKPILPDVLLAALERQIESQPSSAQGAG